MTDIIKCASELKNIKEDMAYSLLDGEYISIQDSYKQSLINRKSCDLDIGIGILHIYNCGDEIRYEFKPTDFLEKLLVNCCDDNYNILDNELNYKLQQEIKKLYKEIV